MFEVGRCHGSSGYRCTRRYYLARSLVIGVLWQRGPKVGGVIVVVVVEVAWLTAAANVNVRTKTVPRYVPFQVLCKPLLEPSATRSPASEAASGVFDDKCPCTSFSEGGDW